MPHRDDSSPPYCPPNLSHLLTAVRRSWKEDPQEASALYGPAQSEGYPDLVTDAISYAWTWLGDERREESS